MFSGLTIRGRCLLAAGVAAGACALLLDERDLLRLAAFIISLPLLALLLTSRTRFAVRGSRSVDPSRTPVGSPTTVRLELTGASRLPLSGLALEDKVPWTLGGSRQFRVHNLAHSGTTLAYTVKPVLRGIHHIGPLQARIGDPFGLSEFNRELAEPSRLVAVPEVFTLTDFPAGFGTADSASSGTAQRQAGHGEDDVMVRQYRQGDDIRRVHWKATARRDELMVRAEEHPWHGGTTVLLDRRSAAHRGSGPHSSLEWAVSAAASIYLHLQQHGKQVELITEDGQQISNAGRPGQAPGAATLEALAALRSSPRRDLVFPRDPGNGQQLIAVLGEISPAGVRELLRLRPRHARSSAILLDARSWSGGGSSAVVSEAAGQLRAAGWAVEVASASTPVPRVWQQLCQSSTVGSEAVS
jgi:uncharacterized protein (DUF58 family)